MKKEAEIQFTCMYRLVASTSLEIEDATTLLMFGSGSDMGKMWQWKDDSAGENRKGPV